MTYEAALHLIGHLSKFMAHGLSSISSVKTLLAISFPEEIHFFIVFFDEELDLTEIPVGQQPFLCDHSLSLLPLWPLFPCQS